MTQKIKQKPVDGDVSECLENKKHARWEGTNVICTNSMLCTNQGPRLGFSRYFCTAASSVLAGKNGAPGNGKR